MPIWRTPYLIESLNSRMAVLHDWSVVLPSLPENVFTSAQMLCSCVSFPFVCLVILPKSELLGTWKNWVFSRTAISSDLNFCKTRIISSSLDLPLSVEFWQSENVPLIWNIIANHENSARPQALWLSGVIGLKNHMKLLCAWNRGIWNTWREITQLLQQISYSESK